MVSESGLLFLGHPLEPLCTCSIVVLIHKWYRDHRHVGDTLVASELLSDVLRIGLWYYQFYYTQYIFTYRGLQYYRPTCIAWLHIVKRWLVIQCGLDSRSTGSEFESHPLRCRARPWTSRSHKCGSVIKQNNWNNRPINKCIHI